MDKTTPEFRNVVEETLDPADWSDVGEISHQIIDDSIAYLRDVRERPIWRDMPKAVRERFNEPVPLAPSDLGEVYRDVQDAVLAYPMGNVHPRFLAWYMGASNFTGALGDFLAAVQGSNLGGGDHAAVLVENQVLNWCKQMVGYPPSASGTLVSGGSMANIIGLTVARNAMADIDLREEGVAALSKQQRFYGSEQMHSCHRKAVELLGLGNRALRRIPTDEDLRIDIEALKTAIREDRAAGFEPACIIATAATVNTGAIDDLESLADLAAEEKLWFHVDGCIGALIAIAPKHNYLVKGIARADSIALDPHKLLHAPFEAGCVLIRDARLHRGSFATTPEYLEHAPRGVASGDWLFDYGLQTSRGFRALKIWMAIKHHGLDAYGRLIDQNIEQAKYLSDRIDSESELERIAPTVVDIVCFRFAPKGLKEEELKPLNVEIMLRLQDEGTAVISDTTVHGRHSLRVAIANHRTTRADLDLLIDEILRLGREILLEKQNET